MSGWWIYMEIFVDDFDRRVYRIICCMCSWREIVVGYISVVMMMFSLFLEILFIVVYDVEGVVSLYVVDYLLLCGC